MLISRSNIIIIKKIEILNICISCLTLIIILTLIIYNTCVKYDIIIVGGGTAGETYAYFSDLHRDKKILILERGRDETQNKDLDYSNINQLFTNKYGNHNPISLISTREPNRGDFVTLGANCLGGAYQVSASVYQKPRQEE